MALGFAPLLLVRNTFAQMQDNAPLALQPLFRYFDQQWLQSVSPSMWNVHNEDVRTNNDLEGWHHGFNKAIGRHHPNIWFLLESFINERASTEVTLQQIAAGHVVGRQRNRVKHLHSRIKRLRRRYARGTINLMRFLNGIANNLHHFG
jgi:hypothetical protein